jgi:hypothetical protein|tara:strand:+ start:183 stop:719 length:537 start_codon:yes stop_codon:yes gene_type:complete
LNKQLSAPPDGFRFSARHLPHISLVQQFSPTTELTVIEQTIADVVSKHPPIGLTLASIATSETTSSLTVTPSPVLDTLHRRLMDQLAIFDVGLGDERAFINTDATPTDAARRRDITWVSQFRTEAAYDAFAPHVTLGVGAVKTTIPKTTFTASVIALCILGRFCTCQEVLASWDLSTH